MVMKHANKVFLPLALLGIMGAVKYSTPAGWGTELLHEATTGSRSAPPAASYDLAHGAAVTMNTATRGCERSKWPLIVSSAKVGQFTNLSYSSPQAQADAQCSDRNVGIAGWSGARYSGPPESSAPQPPSDCVWCMWNWVQLALPSPVSVSGGRVWFHHDPMMDTNGVNLTVQTEAPGTQMSERAVTWTRVFKCTGCDPCGGVGDSGSDSAYDFDFTAGPQSITKLKLSVPGTWTQHRKLKTIELYTRPSAPPVASYDLARGASVTMDTAARGCEHSKWPSIVGSVKVGQLTNLSYSSPQAQADAQCSNRNVGIAGWSGARYSGPPESSAPQPPSDCVWCMWNWVQLALPSPVSACGGRVWFHHDPMMDSNGVNLTVQTEAPGTQMSERAVTWTRVFKCTGCEPCGGVGDSGSDSAYDFDFTAGSQSITKLKLSVPSTWTQHRKLKTIELYDGCTST